MQRVNKYESLYNIFRGFSLANKIVIAILSNLSNLFLSAFNFTSEKSFNL